MLVRPLGPLAVGSVFCALVALGSGSAPWVEAMANSFLPYLAVPLAGGLLLVALLCCALDVAALRAGPRPSGPAGVAP